jgi:hypothetical protein
MGASPGCLVFCETRLVDCIESCENNGAEADEGKLSQAGTANPRMG